MKSIHIPLLLLCLSLGTWLEGQTLKAYKKAAIKAEADKNYSVALANYQVIINDAEKKTDHNYFRAAESARKLKVYPLAEEYYKQVLAGDQKANYPLVDFWLGDVLKRQGKYGEAKEAFERYLAGTGASGGATADKAKKEIADCEWAPAIVQAPTPLQMKHLDQTVNTENTEIAPFLRGKDLYFSSLRESHADGFCAFPTTRIYKAEPGVESSLLDKGFTAADRHSAHTAFSVDGKTMYYTLCETLNPDTTRCAIYTRTQANDGSWGAAQALPAVINNGRHTATQPSVGYDERKEKEVLFFVSDRNGGAGKLDIWCSYIEENGAFGAPYNVADVNTPEDDITPFFSTDLQILYFSSEGRQNLGGFDIYHTENTSGGWSGIKHGGYPLNTSYDDVYYTINMEERKAHLSSNRPGSICADTSNYCVCNDIYEVDVPANIELKVLTFNSITKEPLEGVSVDLNNPGNSGFQIQSFTRAEDHQFNEFSVEFQQAYELKATKAQYTTSLESFANPMPIRDTTIVIKHYLRPDVDLTVKTYDEATGAPLNGVKVNLVLLPPNDLLASKEEEAKNEYFYPLEFSNRYMVIGTKGCYSSDTAYASTEDIPVVPTSLLKELKLRAFKSKIKMDNIQLYFDNDEPGPHTRRITTTTANYEKEYEEYLDDYTTRRKSGFVGPRKVRGYYADENVHTPELRAFFEQKAEKGFRDLKNLAMQLYQDYPDGKIVVTMRGFASTLATGAYNKSLASRRISSVRNYFNNWVDPTGKKSLAGRLEVTEAPMGELPEREGLYPENAIAHPMACEDRKVEIVEIEVTRAPCDPNASNN